MAVRTLPTTYAPARMKIPDMAKPVEVESAFRELVRGRDFTVQDVTVTTSATKVKHKLGRPMTGWQIIDTNADARVWRVEGPAGDLENFDVHFYLQASATVTLRVKVF